MRNPGRPGPPGVLYFAGTYIEVSYNEVKRFSPSLQALNEVGHPAVTRFSWSGHLDQIARIGGDGEHGAGRVANPNLDLAFTAEHFPLRFPSDI